MQTVINKKSNKNTSAKTVGSNNKMKADAIIKISKQGMLLYANSSGIEFLDLISKSLKAPAINYILRIHPEILRPNCETDISFRINSMKFYFTVVSFDEAGYVGLYGTRIMQINIAGNMVA